MRLLIFILIMSVSQITLSSESPSNHTSSDEELNLENAHNKIYFMRVFLKVKAGLSENPTEEDDLIAKSAKNEEDGNHWLSKQMLGIASESGSKKATFLLASDYFFDIEGNNKSFYDAKKLATKLKDENFIEGYMLLFAINEEAVYSYPKYAIERGGYKQEIHLPLIDSAYDYARALKIMDLGSKKTMFDGSFLPSFIEIADKYISKIDSMCLSVADKANTSENSPKACKN